MATLQQAKCDRGLVAAGLRPADSELPVRCSVCSHSHARAIVGAEAFSDRGCKQSLQKCANCRPWRLMRTFGKVCTCLPPDACRRVSTFARTCTRGFEWAAVRAIKSGWVGVPFRQYIWGTGQTAAQRALHHFHISILYCLACERAGPRSTWAEWGEGKSCSRSYIYPSEHWSTYTGQPLVTGQPQVTNTGQPLVTPVALAPRHRAELASPPRLHF